MKKAILLVTILFVSVISTACINNFAVQELNNKAKMYLDKGDYKNAISRLQSSIDLDSTIFETHYNLGVAYTQSEDFPAAVEAFKNAIKLNPNFIDTYYSLAVAQENYAKGIIDGSIKYLGEKSAELEKNLDESSVVMKDGKKKLLEMERVKVAELISSAVDSYVAYLEKGQDAPDRAEVEEKIEYLESEIKKYSDDSSQ